MSRAEKTVLFALVVAVVAGSMLPVGAAAVLSDQTATQSSADNHSANAVNVSVDIGQQLSVVVSTTTSEVRSGASEAGFTQRLESTGPTERADAIADRADDLGERASEIRADYEEATTEYQNGESNAPEYAQEIAVLASQANDTNQSIADLSARADELPDAERRAVGLTGADLAELNETLDPLLTQTTSGILSQYVAASAGEIEITANGGVEIEVTSEDGENARQIERSRDDGNTSYELSQAEALDTARGALSDQSGEWITTSVTTDDGAYEFEFVYDGSAEGEAEVSVDGQTGTVFELEEEIEFEDEDETEDENETENEPPVDPPENEDEDEPEDDENETENEPPVGPPENEDENENETEDENESEVEAGRLAILVTGGVPGPGENVTVGVTAAGDAVAGATITLDEEPVGTTDENGTLGVTLPDSEEVKVEATSGEAEGELEFEFEREDENGDDRELGATADIDNGTVTVSVVLGDSPAADVNVTANGRVVGSTDANGMLSFPLPNEEELEIEVEQNDREAELEYDLEDEDEDEGEDENETEAEPPVEPPENDEKEDEEEDESEGENETEDQPPVEPPAGPPEDDEEDGDEDETESRR